jgi:DNA-binding MarR family transcriptional regulator
MYDTSMNGISPLNACSCFATRQAARHVTRMYERHLAPARVTSTQFSILVLLGDTPGMTMSELSLAMVMDRTSLVRAIKPMQRDGLLTTERAPQESRKLVLSLTALGYSKVREAMPLWEQAQQEFEAQVGPERAAQWRQDFLDMTRST